MKKRHIDDVEINDENDEVMPINVDFYKLDGKKEGKYTRDILRIISERNDETLAIFNNNGIKCYYVQGKIEGRFIVYDNERNEYCQLEFVNGELVCCDKFSLIKLNDGMKYDYYFYGVNDGYLMANDNKNVIYNFTRKFNMRSIDEIKNLFSVNNDEDNDVDNDENEDEGSSEGNDEGSSEDNDENENEDNDEGSSEGNDNICNINDIFEGDSTDKILEMMLGEFEYQDSKFTI
jgi:hypothetical protein